MFNFFVKNKIKYITNKQGDFFDVAGWQGFDVELWRWRVNAVTELQKKIDLKNYLKFGPYGVSSSPRSSSIVLTINPIHDNHKILLSYFVRE